MAIKLCVMDVDGTMTDGKIYMGENGEAVKAFCIKDGYAIHDILPSFGIIPVIITGRKSEIVRKRCAELGITELYQGVLDKKKTMEAVMAKFRCVSENVAYIGDDLNDLTCMELAAVTGCPADASREIREAADFISSQNGGNGAVREFIEWITKDRKL